MFVDKTWDSDSVVVGSSNELLDLGLLMRDGSGSVEDLVEESDDGRSRSLPLLDSSEDVVSFLVLGNLGERLHLGVEDDGGVDGVSFDDFRSGLLLDGDVRWSRRHRPPFESLSRLRS